MMLAEYQALAAEAPGRGRATDAVRALAANPLVGQIDLAERLYAELAAAHPRPAPGTAGGMRGTRC